jgi:hypothetical protein
VQPSHLQLDDSRAVQRRRRIAASNADLEDFEVYDDRIERIPDLVCEIIRQTAYEVETVRLELLFVDRRQL